MNLSEHFSLDELTFSQIALRHGIDNTPDDAEIANLIELCTTLLEPCRGILGAPLYIDSGFRFAPLPYDQIIFECAAWIHIAIAPAGQKPRREALTATGRPGAWVYQLIGR